MWVEVRHEMGIHSSFFPHYKEQTHRPTLTIFLRFLLIFAPDLLTIYLPGRVLITNERVGRGRARQHVILGLTLKFQDQGPLSSRRLDDVLAVEVAQFQNIHIVRHARVVAKEELLVPFLHFVVRHVVGVVDKGDVLGADDVGTEAFAGPGNLWWINGMEMMMMKREKLDNDKECRKNDFTKRKMPAWSTAHSFMVQ